MLWEEQATENVRNAAEATSNDKVATDFRCEICDFKSNRSTGLQVHMSRKHATIEQLDGNTSLPYEVNEKVDDKVEHFLQYGFLRDPSVRVRGQQLWLYIADEMQKCGLSFEERQAEYQLMKRKWIVKYYYLRNHINLCVCNKPQ